jgi:hypothetical protein
MLRLMQQWNYPGQRLLLTWFAPCLPLFFPMRPTMTEACGHFASYFPAVWCGRWSRRGSHISSSAKGDEFAAHFDALSIQEQLAHCCNGHSSY